jgi:exonuclease III
MRVLSWNILQGGGKRISDVVAAIDAHKADTVVLGEISQQRSGELLGALAKSGYTVASGLSLPAGQRGVLVASREEFVARPAPEPRLESHRWVEAHFPRRQLTVVGAYFPDHVAGLKMFWPDALKACTRLRSSPTLITGDLNSGHALLDTQGRFVSSDQWFLAMPFHGFTDLWRHKNGRADEYTWYSPGKKGGNGFRLDHAFGSESLRRRVRACQYCHDNRKPGLSDHSSLIVEVR